MTLTIGMASYNNPEQVWWTVQALRLYHDMTDCEIVIIDNAGNDALKNWCMSCSGNLVKYFRETDRRGTAYPRNKVFERATKEFVVCIDSHVMLAPGSIDKLKQFAENNRGSKDLYQGPMYYDSLDVAIDGMEERWLCNMYGVWLPFKSEFSEEPYEIQMHGLGLFGCYKDAWLGFNNQFEGFGGEEGYIHKKYRKAGHKVICLPFLKWAHRFHDQLSTTTYPNIIEERIRNYVIGWSELGLDINEIREAFSGYDINDELEIKRI